MKITIYLLFFVMLASYVTAGSAETAKVYVNVVNSPPEITGMATSNPLSGEPLECEVVVKDEIEGVKVKYKWYNNDVLIQGQDENVLSEDFFVEGDRVACEAIPNDLVQDGGSEKVSVVIKPKPFASAITGAVVGLGSSMGTFNTFLILLLLAVVIFNVAYFVRRK